MKTFKSLTCAVAVAGILAFCAPSAKAGIGITTNYDALNITVTVTTNIEKITATGYTYTLHSVTHNNADLMKILERILGSSGFDDTNFPTGAKLVVSWDAGENVANGNDGDVLVVDKTGTNVLYDATANYYSGSGSYLYLNFFNEYGPYSESYSSPSKGAGHGDYMEYYNAEFEIYDDANSIDVSTSGRDTENFAQSWTTSSSSINYTSWSDSENTTAYGEGDIDGSANADIVVHVTASGHAKGLNSYMW